MKATQRFSGKEIPIAGRDDHQVFRLLFKQHASGIYHLAYSHLRSHIEAEEIVQECFLKYWEKRQEISSDLVAIKGYLYTSAFHAVVSHVRQKRHWVYQDYSEDLPVLEPEAQLAALEYQELDQHYTHALAQLPTKRREIFAMSRQQGLSNATIAQELNISIKTVEAQMTQALKFLRTYLQAHGITLGLVLLLLQA